MSVLVYAESWHGNFRKSSFEAVSYANKTAKLLGTEVIAISLGEVSDQQLNKLGNYGASKVIACAGIEKGDSQAATNAIAAAANDPSIISCSSYCICSTLTISFFYCSTSNNF